MAWIESHQGLGEHWKAKRLRKLLKINKFEAVGVLNFLWWWSLDHAPTGDLSRYTDDDLADAIGWDQTEPRALVEALQNAEFITPDRQIHDWYDYAGKLIQRRAADAERKRTSGGHPKDVPRKGSDIPTISGDDPELSAGDPMEVRRRSDGPRPDSGVTVTVPNPTGPETTSTGIPPLAEPVANGSASVPPPQDSGVHESPNPGDSLEPIDFQAPTPIRVKRPPSNKYAEVIELVNQAGVPLPTGPRDGKAVKSCSAPPGDIAAAYVARALGEWVPYRLRDSFSLHSVIDELAGWLSRDVRAQPPNRRRTLLPGDPNRFDQYEEARRIHVAEMDERQRQVAADMATQQKGYA